MLERAGVPVERVAKLSESAPLGAERSVGDLIRGGEVDMVINTPFGRGPRTDGWSIRTAAAQAQIPCITTLPGVLAALRGVEAQREAPSEPRSLQELHELARSNVHLQERLGFAGDQAEVGA